ncbi:hypothetical protein LTR36_001257 [Oleoguttula mirabilis]|uniref:Uncharacterized protein n=1 Tax=Oleoguttula mirabilis TaxID=1507867 RepID=A0AAV9JNA0_9PEZI|nr:hypothetical protein LTR36_001257 [Oleoguttula mirabilis]
MSNPPANVWHTAARSRHSHTPQNRSGTASPAQTQPTQAPRQDAPRQDGGRPQQQVNNVWTQRSSSAGGGSNGQRAEQQDEQSYTSINGFNAAEVKAFLSRDAAVPASYKVVEGSSAGAGRGGGGGAWGAKPNHMANNQPFFVQLAKQIATMEGGG